MDQIDILPSVGFCATATALTRISLGPGFGIGTSLSTEVPSPTVTTAFMLGRVIGVEVDIQK
jgi:hypothetical protein